MNILIVEDEIPVANFIKRIIRDTPLVTNIETAHSFHDGFQKSLSASFDLILVDILLGENEFSGIELCKSIRKGNSSVPLIIITSLHSLEYLEEAFSIGVNDYICKPFRPRELQLRVKRWSSFCEQGEFRKWIEYKNLLYNPQKNEFHYHGQKLSLSKKNKALLTLFVKNSDKVISQQYIRSKLWGDYDFQEKGRNVRSNIHLLRQALQSSCRLQINTIRGEGYMLEEAPEKVF